MTLFDPVSLVLNEAGATIEDQPAAAETTEPDHPAAPETAEPDEAPASTTRVRLLVAYDGGDFRGFAAQDGQRTVAGELSRAISTVARHKVELVCAGRTDAGVHAVGQVVHVDVREDLAPERIAKAVNSMLGPEVVVRSAAHAPAGFDARRSATARLYRYLVVEGETPDPLLSHMAWLVRDQLDLRTMSAAADSLVGEHDFSAFCRRPPGASRGQPIPRKVLDDAWSISSWGAEQLAAGRLLRFDIRAQSFCHQMVRSIVGTLVDVGRGRRRVSEVNWLLHSGDRSRATTVAPPHGLCLMGVEYGQQG